MIQSDPFNASRLNTAIAAVITSNTGLAAMPGNVFVPAQSGTEDVFVARGLRRLAEL